MKKKILCLLIGLMMTIPAYASIALSPTRLEINATKIKTNYVTTSVEIRGDEQKPMRFKVYPEFFTVNEKSELVQVEKSNDPRDLSKKIRFVPSEFTVLPGKVQKLRVNIANIKSLPDGESRTMLYLEDVNAKEYAIPSPQSGIGMQLIVKTRAGIPVYVDKGKVQKIGEIEYLNVVKEKDGLYTDMKILSKGNSKIRYNAKIQIFNGKKLVKEYSLVSKVVEFGSYYITKDKVDTEGIAPGEYTLRATIFYEDTDDKLKTLKKETQINIKGEM